MNNEENYQELQKVMHEWVNPKTFATKALLYNKNTVEHVDHTYLKSINLSISDKNNVPL